MHHNVAGYSGTDGNAVWVHHNNIYDNALGFTTDVFTAAGHPGFPRTPTWSRTTTSTRTTSTPTRASSDVEPTIPVPVGTGLWIAGGNDNTSATTTSGTTGAAES